jgi:hypothetical protein
MLLLVLVLESNVTLFFLFLVSGIPTLDLIKKKKRIPIPRGYVRLDGSG